MRQAVQKQLGSLKTLLVPGQVGGPCVVLFHGYGADASDLLPLSDMMGLSKDVTWVFPDAPMEVIIAPGFYGKAWFPIDTNRLEMAMRHGEPADMSGTTPNGLDAARKVATSLYEDLLKTHSKVVLGGFSQGAMLATEVSLTHATKPAGLVILSGTLICRDRWEKMIRTCEGVPFIQSHGKNDALLGYQYAENLYQVLTNGGMHGEFVGFSGGHEIPPKVIEKTSQFLKGICRLGR